MGTAIPMPACIMLYTAAPLSDMVEVPQSMIADIESYANGDDPDSFTTDMDTDFSLSSEFIELKPVISFRWNSGVYGLRKESNDDSQRIRVGPRNIDQLLRAIEEKDVKALDGLSQDQMAKLLEDLVYDTRHPLSFFDAKVPEKEQLFISHAIALLSKRIGNRAGPIFHDALLSPESTRPVQLKAISGINFGNVTSAAPQIIEVLEREPVYDGRKGDDPVRMAALHAINGIGDLSALPALAKIISDGSRDERIGAIEVTGNIVLRFRIQSIKSEFPADLEAHRQSELASALVSSLAHELESIAFDCDEEPIVRRKTLVSIGKIGPQSRFFPPLMKLLERFIYDDNFPEIDERYTAEDIEQIYKGVVEALGWLGDSHADRAIIKIAMDITEERGVRLEAIKTLYKLETPDAVDALSRIAMDGNDSPLNGEAAKRLMWIASELDPNADYD